MKPDQPADHEARLNAALDAWSVDAELPPRFQEQVWQRIARAESQPTVSGFQRWLRWVNDRLAQPKVAFSYVAILVLLGFAAGSATAHLRSAQFNTVLSARYVQSVDPYQEVSSQP